MNEDYISESRDEDTSFYEPRFSYEEQYCDTDVRAVSQIVSEAVYYDDSPGDGVSEMMLGASEWYGDCAEV